MRYLIIAAAALATSPVHADIYKCKTADGTVYQEAPCKNAGGTMYKSESMQTPSSKASSSPPQQESESTRIKRFTDDAERSRKIREANHEITLLEEANQRLTKSMDSELAALRERKGRANNNLAGATLEGSISSEMQAVTTRYTSEINQNNDKIKRLRDDIARLQK